MNIIPQKILSDLIKTNSSNPPGNETAVAVYLKALFEQWGINGEIIEPETGRGSFIARLGNGNGSKKMLYVSHADVVPAGDDWDFEPFSGEIKDGIIYGRGALDCKDLMAAQVSAALQIIAEGKALDGELIIAALADEEKGGKLGAGYLVEKHLDKIKADFAINEGAEQPIIVNGKMIYFFQVGEKGTAWCKLKARGVSGHGSVPTLAENAIVKLARAIDGLSSYKPEIVIIPEVKKLISELASLSNIATSEEAFADLDALLDRMDLDRAFRESLRSMSRMTVSPNVISGGTKTNIVPDYCEADIDIRILPGQDSNYVHEQLRQVVGDKIEIEFTQEQKPTFTSTDKPYYNLMVQLTKKLAGNDIICLPAISSGSTDSKYLRNAGIPSYGIGHMAKGFDRSARVTVHGRNERTDVESVQLKTAFLKELALSYLSS